MFSIDSLFEKSSDELSRLYGKGSVPDSREMGERYRGTVPGVESRTFLGRLSKPISLLSNVGLLPWLGKSFSTSDGRGNNRVLMNRFQVAPFEFYRDTSLFDDEPSLVLDYGIDENPFPLGLIRDEVREIADDLLLGQIYLKPTSSLVLYFALERDRTQI